MTVSVIIPAYNCENFIKQSLLSVLSDMEVIDEVLICNDSSTDRTLEAISSIADSRIKVISNERNQGIAFTLNRLIELAKNDIICRMDADDIWMKGRRKSVVDYFTKPENTNSVLFGSYIVFNSTGEKSQSNRSIGTTSTFYLNSLFIKGDYLHPTMNILGSTLKKFYYNDQLSGVEDLDLYMRFLKAKIRLFKSDSYFLMYRRDKKASKGYAQFKLQCNLVKFLIKRNDFINALILQITFMSIYFMKVIGVYPSDRKFTT